MRSFLATVCLLTCTSTTVAGPQPIAQSPIVTAKTPGHKVALSADLQGARDLFLVVDDAGDGISCDWADWIHPRLTGPAGTLPLTQLKWTWAETASGKVRVNRNSVGEPLRVGGKPVDDGIGTHAQSLIRFRIPEGYSRLETECGLDNGGTDQNGGSTVRFLVYTEHPGAAILQSGPERTPEQALPALDSPDDLQATLLAAEPTLLSPSSIDVDHLGRIWICEVVNYRRFANKGFQDREEGDRILVLQDTDGDGTIDSSHTFYQGRDIDSAHGICVLGNRVIVSALDSVISFYDDDGDLTADRREVLFTGIQGAQHDHGIHAFTFGPDGRLYFNFGNHGRELHRPDGSLVTDIAGHAVQDDRNPYQQGMAFRCDLDGSHVETLGWNFRNNWELAVDSYGSVWQSDNDDDGNRGTRINFVMEYGNYGYKDELTGAGWREPRTGWEDTIPERHWHLNDPGVVPNLILTGAGAPCGIEVYEASLLPERFHNQLLHCDAGVNVVRSYAVRPDGAGYAASINNLLTGTRDRWFRPCDVSLAADGSLIIADWYDPGVGGHRQGDIDRGRLFRIAPRGVTWTHPTFRFDTIEGALQGLLSCNRDARYQGWQKLAAEGKAAEAALQEVYNNHPDPRRRARALWLLAKIKDRTQHYIQTAAGDADENLRIVAVRLARQHQTELAQTIERLSRDESPAVRRACIIALCNLPPKQRLQPWVQLANQLPPADRWYLEALGIAAQGLWDRCLPDILNNTRTPQQLKDDILWRSRADSTAGNICQRLRVLAADVPPAQLARWFRALDFQADAHVHPALQTLLDIHWLTTLPKQHAEFVAAEVLQRLNPTLLQESERSVVNTIVETLPIKRRVSLVERFRLTQRYPELVEQVVRHGGGQQGVDALQSLVRLGQQDQLAALITGDNEEQADAVLHAAGNARSAAFRAVLQQLIDDEDASPALRRRAVRAALRIQSMTGQIVAQVKADELSDSLRQTVAAEMHSSADGKLRQMAQQLFPLPDARAGEKLPTISELLKRSGDAKRGRLVFNTTGTCFKCHVVNGLGRDLGPGLSDIGRKLSRQALYEAVLFPSAGITHNYDTWTVLLNDGTSVTGLKVSQTEETLVLMDNEALKHSISTNDVDELVRQSTSLMPADLQKIMSTQELVDVVTYLETLKTAAPAKP